MRRMRRSCTSGTHDAWNFPGESAHDQTLLGFSRNAAEMELHYLVVDQRLRLGSYVKLSAKFGSEQTFMA